MNKRIARKVLKDAPRYHPHQINAALKLMSGPPRKRKHRQ